MPEDRPSDSAGEQLRSRIRRGQSAAFEELYDQHSVNLYRFAFSLCRNTDTAADLVQTLFLKLVQQHKKVSQAENLPAYLFRTLRNLVVDHLRKHRVAPLENPELTSEDRPIGKALETRDWLDHVLMNLNESEREVLALKAAGNTFDSMASILEIPPSTVATQYRRALQKARRVAENSAPSCEGNPHAS